MVLVRLWLAGRACGCWCGVAVVWCRGCCRVRGGGWFAGSGWAVAGVCGRELRGWMPLDVGFSLAGRSVFEDRAVVLGVVVRSCLVG